MKQFLEFSVFLAGATALHLSVGNFVQQGQDTAAGEAGNAELTLTAANNSIQDMIATWDRPPKAGNAVTIPEPIAPDFTETVMPSQDRPLPLKAVLPLNNAQDAADLPQVDRSTPIPPPAKAAQTRPKLRPKVAAQAAESAKKNPEARKPVPKKSANTAPQKAAGTGGKKAKGKTGSGAATKPKAGHNKALMAGWGGQIRSSIERRKRYPAGTRSKGTVTLVISVHTVGKVTGVSIRRSSGVTQIDRAAIAAVKSARIPVAPKGLSAGVHSFTLPMKFAP